MLALSFTASRQGFNPPPAIALGMLAGLPPASRYVTGACRGGDAFLGRWLLANHPGAEHIVIVPADRSRVDAWWLDPALPRAKVTVFAMPPGTAYKDRNAMLVKRADQVTGFPAFPEDDPRSARSGTWQAIRMARAAGKLLQWQCVLPPYPAGGPQA
jgi:hypothetical protein